MITGLFYRCWNHKIWMFLFLSDIIKNCFVDELANSCIEMYEQSYLFVFFPKSWLKKIVDTNQMVDPVIFWQCCSQNHQVYEELKMVDLPINIQLLRNIKIYGYWKCVSNQWWHHKKNDFFFTSGIIQMVYLGCPNPPNLTKQ